jgi:hypothetical protein
VIGITTCREAASGENWKWMVSVAWPRGMGVPAFVDDQSINRVGVRTDLRWYRAVVDMPAATPSQPPTEAEGLRPSLNFVLNH